MARIPSRSGPGNVSNYLLLNRQRKHAVNAPGMRRFLSQLTDELGRSEASFTVVLVTDKVMRAYNQKYRGFDKTTDVLSFRSGGEYLGDILISAETAYNQASKSRSLTLETNVHRLMLHGFLHLIGYDHETDDGEMRAIEKRLRRRLQC